MSEVQAPENMPCVAEIKAGDDAGFYEIDLYHLTRRHRIWAERKSGLTTSDWFRNKAKALLESTELATVFAALAIARGKGDGADPDDVFEDLLDRDDDYMAITVGMTAEELQEARAADESGPTKQAPAESGETSKPKRRATGTQAS